MPCDYPNSSLLSAERVIRGTYKDELGRVCTVPLKCHDTGDGLYALATEQSPATKILAATWHNAYAPAKPGVAYHLLSVQYTVSFGSNGPEKSYPNPTAYVEVSFDGVYKDVSALMFSSDATNVHIAVIDPLNFLCPPGASFGVGAFDGITVVRYREVVVK